VTDIALRKSVLNRICSEIDAILKDLNMLKDAIEQGQISFSDQDYFNIAVSSERIREAKERLETIIRRS